MSRFDTAGQYWQEVTDKLMNSKEEYAHFLKFSSEIYKHDFTDAAMIYHQNPHASKVAELETWNRLGRRVNRGERGIVSFGNGGKCKYLFDVSQTNGRKEPELWKLDEKLSDRLLAAINEKNGTEWKNLNEAISKICLDSMKQTMSMGYYPDTYEKYSAEDRKKFNRSVLSCARYIASNRCQLGGSISLDNTLNLEGMDLCKSRNEFAKFASLAHSTAKSALLYMEHELFEVMKKIRQEQLDIFSPAQEKSENISVKEIPFTTGDIFDMEGKLYKVDEIELAADNVRLSEIHTGQTKSISIDELSLFFTEEQKRELSVDSAIDTVLQGNPEIIIENAPVEVSPEIPALTDESVIAEIIRQGERYERNEDIQSCFIENTDIDFRAGYISSLYRDGISELKINGIDYNYEKTENGLAVWQGTNENREKQSVLSWDCVQAVIADSIERGVFLHSPEKEISSQTESNDIEKFYSEDVVDMESETETVSENIRNIRCETAKEAEQLFDYLRDNDYTWSDGEELTITDWFYGENNTFYSVDANTQTVERKDISAYSYNQIRDMNVEDFADVKSEFVQGSSFREPEQTAEKKYDLHFIHNRSSVNVYDFSEGTYSKPIAAIDSDRNVSVGAELPKSVMENIYEYANGMADIYKLPEIRKPRDGEPTVTITFSETPSSFYNGLTMPFSQADEIFGEADKNYTESRNNAYSADNFIGYSKVDFTIKGGSDNPDFEYSGRYDLGEGENGLMNHIKNQYEYMQSHTYKNSLRESDYEEYERELGEFTDCMAYLEKSLKAPEHVKEIWSAYTQYINDVRIAQIGRKKDESKPLYGGNVEYCSGIFKDDDEQGFNVEFARGLAKQLNQKGISDLRQAAEFVNSEIAERDDFSDINITDKTYEVSEHSEEKEASKSSEWFVHTAANKNDGYEYGYIGRKKNPEEPIIGKNMEYCNNYFSDDNEQGFNIAFAQEIADKLNSQGITDLQQAREFVEGEVTKREKKLAAEIPQVKYAVCFSRAENIDKGITSYITEQNKVHDESLVVSIHDDYKAACDAQSAYLNEHTEAEIFEMCPYYEREIKMGSLVRLDGEDYEIYSIDKDSNSVELAKPEDIDSTIPFIMRNDSNKPPVRTESYDYINGIFNEKSITVPKQSKSVDELALGDIIRYGDITGKINGMNDTNLTLETGSDPVLGKTYSGIMFWKDKFEKDGFEYLGHEGPERRENVPDKKKNRKKEADTYDGQLDLFGENYNDEPVRPIEYPQNAVDDFLRCGGYDSQSTERIIAEYSKGKSNGENADFLKKEFGGFAGNDSIGSGITDNGVMYSLKADDEGIRINSGDTAYGKESVLIPWEKAAERVGELLDSGEYAPQELIDKSKEYSLYETAEAICYIQRELDDKHRDDFFIDKEVFLTGFPEATERVAEMLRKSDNLAEFTKAAEKLAAECRNDSKIIPVSYEKERMFNLPRMLSDLQIKPREYTAAPDFKPAVHSFISNDELDSQLMKGRNTSVVKGDIYDYFTEGHTDEEKTKYIKNHYGTGGSYAGRKHISYDSKGLEIERKNPMGNNPKKLFSWKTVADVIDKAIKNGTYFSEQERAAYVKYAKDILNNKERLNEYGKGYIERLKGIVEKHDIAGSKSVKSDAMPEPENSRENIFTVRSAVRSNYEGMVALYGADERVYLGKSENYDSAGNYDNSDDSLVYISDNDKMFDFLSAYAAWTKSQQEMLDSGAFTLEDYREFTRLQETVLAKYSQIKDVTFDGEKFKPISDRTVLKAPEKEKGKNYRFSESDIVQGGQKSKYRANVEAIKTLLTAESENRAATPEEQSAMAKYSGWGGMPQAFDRHNENWAEEYNELRKLLSNSEYTAARASSLTSFYTPPQVTDAVYQALEQFGFKGGNVLEPSMGVGNFFAKMPEEMSDNSKLYGVELDSISGRIAKQLYPNANIQIKGFEQTAFSDNSFDVAVGNIPFGDIGVFDKDYNKQNFKIHDYFAAKTVDKVKQGGIVALVTSKFTMDKQDEKARKYLAERCDLLGAVRLPAGTFKDADNVTTDILFLKKRDTRTIETPEWVHMSETPDGVPCNKYFVDNPDMVLGKMEFDKRMQGKYGADSKVTVCSPTEGDFTEKLKTAISKIKGEIAVNQSVDSRKRNDDNIIPADPSVRNFTHTMVNGELYHRRNEIMVKTEATGKTLERMTGLHNIRQAAMAVINAQSENCSDSEHANLQRKLNKVYDDFRREFGCISDKANAKVFKQDDDYNTLCAFEIVNKETKEVVKADIFSKRTITAEEDIKSVETPDEALQVSLDRMGKVDIPYMAELLGKSPDETVESLGDLIYLNPAKISSKDPYSGYEEASEYLSGNVREKLDIARAYAETVNPEYERNAAALEKVLPETIQAEDIAVRIGANWIENKDYSEFMKKVLGCAVWDDRLTRSVTGEYKIVNKTGDRGVMATSTYGTQRMNSTSIFENLLNNRDIVVRDAVEDEDGNKKYVVNQKETQLAKNKARAISEKFKKWFWSDIDRREYYVEKYNRLFNSIRGREYDGSHQTFPGMNPAIKLRPHQQNAVLRAKLGSNTLLAHCVGAGKSFEMDAAVMEKKRLGLIKKACVVVPKHLTLQTAYEWQRLYPNAKLLVATPEDFKPDNRKQFIGKCVTGDYDAVIMSYNQFERIPMSDTYRAEFMKNQIDKLDEALDSVDRSDRVTVKDLERAKEKLKVQLEKLLNSPKDSGLNFEQLGFDYLVVDEAHNYKNCLVVSKMSNVAGVQTTSAKKSEDMLMKTQYLNEKYGYGNVLWATGTPVSNSMVELYSMTRYLRPDLLEQAGLENFDDWASTFGEVVSQLELKPAGDGFRMKNRFSKFVNLPELMQMYKEFADIKMPDSLNIPNVPKMQTGKPIIVTAKPDALQQAYMKELAARSEAIQNGNIDPRVDNMLKITHEARLLGLDSRTINKDFIPNPDSKVNLLLDNLKRIRTETDKDKGVQIVFCDIAIHDDDNRFSVYEAIKQGLQERGIPENEICFAGDAKTDTAKAKMYDELRSGDKRFIIASTSKLGTGANVQDRVADIHHLDIPWRPADLEQQNGRGLRQGNKFKEVGIYHYVTEGTFDAYMLGIITAKAKFISQIMTSKAPARTCEDVDEMVLNYAVMSAVATGNPKLKRRIELQNEIAELKVVEADYNKNQYRMQELSERTLPEAIARDTKLLEKAKADIQTYESNKPEEFEITLDGVKYGERTEAGKALEAAILKCSVSGESQKLGTYAGFEVFVEKNQSGNLLSQSVCTVKLHGKLDYYCDVSLKNEVGNIRRIENLAKDGIAGRAKDIAGNIEKAKENLAAAKEALGKPFEHEEKLKKDIAELAEVDAELGTDKVDDFAPVDDSSLGGSSEDETEDISEKREKLFAVKKFDISGLQPEVQQEQPADNSPAAPDLDNTPPVKEMTERKKNKSI